MTHPGAHRLQRYALGELTADLRLEVDAHVAACERCRRLVEAERRLDALVVESLPASPVAADERATFDRLWERVDAADADPAGPAGAGGREDAALATAAGGRAADASVAEGTPTAPRLVGPAAAGSARGARRVALLVLAAAAAWLLVVLLGGDDAPAGTAPRPVADGPRGEEPWPADPMVRPRVSEEVPAPVSPREPVPAEPLVGSPVAPSPAVWEPVDEARLERARRVVAEVLRAADERFPFAQDAFRLAVEDGLADLRAQGWPVAALTRGLALGDDAVVAEPALRHATLEPTTHVVLARALDDPDRRSDALAVLEAAGTDVGACASLVRGLERIARGDEPADLRRAARVVLRASSGPRVRHAWERLAGDAADDLGRARDDEAVLAALDLASDELPPDLALEVLLAGVDDPGRRASTASVFLARVADDAALAGAAAARLDRAFARSGPLSDGADAALLDWCVAAGRRELVPVLVRALGDGRDVGPLLTSLTALGGVEAVAGLADLHREATRATRATAFRDALADLLRRDADLARRYAASLPLESSEALGELHAALPADARRGLLLGALEAHADAPDPGGHRGALLVALGRAGDAADGAALLDWIAERRDHDPLLPLAWAAAGRLDAGAAADAWSARGGDPHTLAEVVDDVSPRLAAAQRPPSRALAPLDDALRRVTPARSKETPP